MDQRQLELQLTGPGLLLQLDTRDNQFYSRKGLYDNAELQCNLTSLGSDRGYATQKASLNAYLPLGQRHVLALRAAACHASDDAPFFDVCLYGSGGDLRGYEAGRYREHAQLTLQGELRMKWTQR